jgi:hypothetical protein
MRRQCWAVKCVHVGRLEPDVIHSSGGGECLRSFALPRIDVDAHHPSRRDPLGQSQRFVAWLIDAPTSCGVDVEGVGSEPPTGSLCARAVQAWDSSRPSRGESRCAWHGADPRLTSAARRAFASAAYLATAPRRWKNGRDPVSGESAYLTLLSSTRPTASRRSDTFYITIIYLVRRADLVRASFTHSGHIAVIWRR